jgi:hypothetical protein
MEGGKQDMFAKTMGMLVLAVASANLAQASVITLIDTIPSGNLFLQPPVLTGGGDAFGGSSAGNVLADAFTVPTSANLDQISVVVDYSNLPGLIGMSPMLLTLLTDSSDSPGTPIESWIIPLDPADVEPSLAIVTATSITQPLLLSGKQYWLSVVPTNPAITGIGWGLASASFPGIQLPTAESGTGVNSGWNPTITNLANEFSVSGTPTPEPGTLSITALTVAAIFIGLGVKLRAGPAVVAAAPEHVSGADGGHSRP